MRGIFKICIVWVISPTYNMLPLYGLSPQPPPHHVIWNNVVHHNQYSSLKNPPHSLGGWLNNNNHKTCIWYECWKIMFNNFPQALSIYIILCQFYLHVCMYVHQQTPPRWIKVEVSNFHRIIRLQSWGTSFHQIYH